MKFRIVSILLLFIHFNSSCKYLESKNNHSIANTYSDTINAAIVVGSFIESSPISVDSLQITQFFRVYTNLRPYQEEVFQFYRKRSFELAWHDNFGKIEAFQILFNRVMQMEENGLTEEVPHLEDFKRFANKGKNDSVEFVDVMQTTQYFHFARRVLEGLPEQDLHALDWHIPKVKKNYTELLDKFIAGEQDAFDKVVFPQYQLLRIALIQLRQIQQNGGWPNVPITQSSLSLNQNNPIIGNIKKRLKVSGEFQLYDSSDLFNTDLEGAVRQFQQNHGLLSDGIVGRNTVKAMNISIEERIKQVMVNMERCRWLPIKMDKDYILVNIPAYSLQVMNGDSLVLECEAIVGKETNKTAIFKGMMKYIVFNPFWNIPDQIVEKEIMPAVFRNKDYLKENHMEWHGGRLRQTPGPDNALGAIKFVFPNPFDIYLHDTPVKGLFKEQKRAFSHGCIRISAPYQLATYLLRSQAGWTSQKMDEILSRSKEYYVKLDEGVPVYILYLTSFIDVDGKLNFREDIYQKDAALARLLIKN
jgi:murein L,D-transpeptidase YcbB/YkuD